MTFLAGTWAVATLRMGRQSSRGTRTLPQESNLHKVTLGAAASSELGWEISAGFSTHRYAPNSRAPSCSLCTEGGWGQFMTEVAQKFTFRAQRGSLLGPLGRHPLAFISQRRGGYLGVSAPLHFRGFCIGTSSLDVHRALCK